MAPSCSIEVHQNACQVNIINVDLNSATFINLVILCLLVPFIGHKGLSPGQLSYVSISAHAGELYATILVDRVHMNMHAIMTYNVTSYRQMQ